MIWFKRKSTELVFRQMKNKIRRYYFGKALQLANLNDGYVQSCYAVKPDLDPNRSIKYLTLDCLLDRIERHPSMSRPFYFRMEKT